MMAALGLKRRKLLDTEKTIFRADGAKVCSWLVCCDHVLG